MKVFRKKLYMKEMHRTEEQCEGAKWPVWCDGAQVSNSYMQGKDGQTYEADASWCEDVTSLDCQSDIDSMKDWPIGTEHVVRMNGKDVRVVVCSVHTSNMLDYKGCNDCALHGPCGGRVPCCRYERTNKDPVYFEHAEAQKSTDKELVLNLHFSPEYNITFTEHNVNHDVGFETGKYYRFIGRESDIRVTLHFNMRKILEHTVLKCTKGSGRKANFEGAGDLSNEIMYTWMYDGDEKKEFKYWKEMRPLVVVQAPDIITFNELVSKIKGSGNVTGLFVARESKDKEKQKMKVDENFTFKKKYIFGTTLHEPKVVKTHKAYANDGACEACGLIISKGSFVLTANETDCNKVTKKTHRLCASCTADYIKATSGVSVEEPKTYAQKQAEWVKENNIKVGTKVRFTKGFKTAEDGSGCCEHRDAKGVEGFVSDIEVEYLFVRIPCGGWAVPFTALEVVPEEPWFKIGDKVRITIKSSVAYNKIGTVTNISMHKDSTQTVYMSFEEFWDTKAFNADSKEKIGELYTPTYAERQAEWIKKHNLKEGDKIVILRTAKGGEDGWCNSWTGLMSKMVGRVFTYDTAYKSGISLSCGYNWPYFVLGVVKE